MRPDALVPSETRPGYGASAFPGSRLAIAAIGSRQTWPPSATSHGRGGLGSGGAIHRSRLSVPTWAANTVGGVRPWAPSPTTSWRSAVQHAHGGIVGAEPERLLGERRVALRHGQPAAEGPLPQLLAAAAAKRDQHARGEQGGRGQLVRPGRSVQAGRGGRRDDAGGGACSCC